MVSVNCSLAHVVIELSDSMCYTEKSIFLFVRQNGKGQPHHDHQARG